MAALTISEVAKRLGVRSSTIRYYEEIGILPPAHRLNGQRRYDQKVLYRLAVIQHSQRAGFSLPEIRQFVVEAADASQRFPQDSSRTPAGTERSHQPRCDPGSAVDVTVSREE